MPYIKTGVRMKCPKCGREGEVVVRIRYKRSREVYVRHGLGDKCSVSYFDLPEDVRRVIDEKITSRR